MKIIFTGHRDTYTSLQDLESILLEFPGAVWVHGGAPGFDSQVESFARSHGIIPEVIRPNYKAYYPKRAPLERDLIMVAMADLVVACYDGREKGGTAFTVKAAHKAGKQVRFVSSHPIIIT